MTTTLSPENLVSPSGAITNPRAQALAGRLEQGARALADFARSLSAAEWQSKLPKDGRKIGVVVHHVADIYPLETKLSLLLADGEKITGVMWDDVHALNAGHARQFDAVDRETTLELLVRNSSEAASRIRSLRDEQLDRAATVSLYGDAPLTCQFFLEDHQVRHSFHHLAKIRAALGR
jgi:hypothetical protein